MSVSVLGQWGEGMLVEQTSFTMGHFHWSVADYNPTLSSSRARLGAKFGQKASKNERTSNKSCQHDPPSAPGMTGGYACTTCRFSFWLGLAGTCVISNPVGGRSPRSSQHDRSNAKIGPEQYAFPKFSVAWRRTRPAYVASSSSVLRGSA